MRLFCFSRLLLAGFGILLAVPSLPAQVVTGEYDVFDVNPGQNLTVRSFSSPLVTMWGNNSLTIGTGTYNFSRIDEIFMGSGASLNISAHGQLQMGFATINGDNVHITLAPTTSASQALIDGFGQFYFYGSGAVVTINSRAQIIADTFYFGYGGHPADAINNQMIVTGVGAQLQVGSDFVVGWAALDGSERRRLGEGTLTVQNGGNVSANNGVILARDAMSSGTLNIGAYDLTNPTTAGTVTSPSVTLAGGTGVINFNQTNATSFSANIMGYGSVTQRGTGTTTLSGDNAGFVGSTTLAAGTLIAGSNTAFGTSAVTVTGGTLKVGGYTLGNTITFNGGTLTGTGTLTGAVSLGDDAHLAPGNSPGTLTFTNGLTLNDGSILDFQLGSSSDLIRVSGGTLRGSASADGITINLSDSGGFTANTYVLFDFTGASLADFNASDFELGTTIAGYNYNFVLTGTSLELVATVTGAAVPEPSTCAALAGALALGCAAFRRRRASN